MSLMQLSKLLPLPDDELQEVLDYASTLSKQDAADQFNNLLGDSPQSIEFISAFNSRRRDTVQSPSQSTSASHSQSYAAATEGVPKPTRASRKKRPPLHALPARQVESATYAAQGTAYLKKDEDDYISKRSSNSSTPRPQPKPDTAHTPPPSAPPSVPGHLISDFKPNKPASRSAPSTRTSSPGPPRAKVNITGGTPMQGASAALSELDAAIRSLEVSTNPTLLDDSQRRCDCIATRHPLLAAAPNCLNCGKVICAKEGVGPCTFCGTPLLSSSEVQAMIRELKEERGREKMAINKSMHRRADISRTPAPFSNPRFGGPTPSEQEQGLSAAEIQAREHRNRLLGYQAQNAKRTTVRDEAADFETPDVGVSPWASPSARARQLKKQQKILRELEWNARPEYERRREVVSIDLVGGKVVRRMGRVEQPKEEEEEQEEEKQPLREMNANENGGAFSRNPLLGHLVRPAYHAGKGKDKATNVDMEEHRRRLKWRRVQDDYEDNEEVILDGGVFGATDRQHDITSPGL